MAQAQPDSRATPKRIAFGISSYLPRAFHCRFTSSTHTAFDQNTKDMIIARELHS